MNEMGKNRSTLWNTALALSWFKHAKLSLADAFKDSTGGGHQPLGNVYVTILNLRVLGFPIFETVSIPSSRKPGTVSTPKLRTGSVSKPTPRTGRVPKPKPMA